MTEAELYEALGAIVKNHCKKVSCRDCSFQEYGCCQVGVYLEESCRPPEAWQEENQEIAAIVSELYDSCAYCVWHDSYCNVCNNSDNEEDFNEYTSPSYTCDLWEPNEETQHRIDELRLERGIE